MAKAPSLNEIRSRCHQFVVNWRNEEGYERGQAQSFVRELLWCFGVTDRRAAIYEARAKRSSTGQQGFIDALVPGKCVIEMKSKGKDLELAESQALDYCDGLSDAEQPQYVITSDFFTFRILDLLSEDDCERNAQFSLEELPDNCEKLAFLAGYQMRSFANKEQEAASIKAAQLMASLYEELHDSGYDDHEASIFLVRTLFALYADDAGVWEHDQFFEFIESRTEVDGSDLGAQMAMLFQILSKRPDKRQKNIDELLRRFPHVNGGIFQESLSIPAFNKAMRDKLLECCAFNWSAISPAIFGSLFQAVKSTEARRELGEHYTTETNILKTINPLFMDELRERFERNFDNVSALKRLRTDMSKMRFLDPACGCGNFLVIAYREMRELDLKILLRLQELGDKSETEGLFFTKENLPVSIENFFGIEIEEWPARIAETALHLADHQANKEMERALGKAPEPLPLESVTTIHVGNALRCEWNAIVPAGPDVRIMGNPPFIGQYLKSVDQKEDLKLVWGKHYNGYLDYVTGWYKKAIDYFEISGGGQGNLPLYQRIQ